MASASLFYLDCAVWVVRIFSIAVGVWTIREVYNRSTPDGMVRKNAGRISGAVVLWLAAVMLSATVADAIPFVRSMSRVMINGAGVVFCLAVVGIAKSEQRLQH